jgi:CHAT domain-containing protein
MESYEVINLPSVTTLSILRNRIPSDQVPSRQILVFADPVFEGDDPRIETNRNEMAGSIVTGRHSELSSVKHGFRRAVELPRLPGTRREASVIAEVAGEENTEIALDFAASRSHAINAQLSDYRIIHFATHSVFEDEHPELSAVILSLYDRDGNSQDGFLRLEDIYNLNLSADLVVLSSCDTASGKYIKGEGVVSLTRGFIHAGALGVLATLWRVDDDATIEFMKQFYEGILERHEAPSASVREAQIALRKHKRWESPYYWAGFIVEGDWR